MSCHSGWLETFVVDISRLLWDGCHAGGWFETPLDRLVDGTGTSRVWSGGRVAGFLGMFGKVRCGKI